MYGQLIISMFVCLDAVSGRGKPVRLATYTCKRESCEQKLAEFEDANRQLWSTMRGRICAEWVARDHVL